MDAKYLAQCLIGLNEQLLSLLWIGSPKIKCYIYCALGICKILTKQKIYILWKFSNISQNRGNRINPQIRQYPAFHLVLYGLVEQTLYAKTRCKINNGTKH